MRWPGPRRALGLGLIAALLPGLLGCAPEAGPAGSAAGARPEPAPAEAPPATAASCALSLRDALSREERVRGVLMLHAPGADGAGIAALAREEAVGGLIAMGENTAGGAAETAARFAPLRASALPPLLAVDQEGGEVARLPGDDWPAGAALAGQPPAAVTAAFAARAELVRSAGLTLNFGVVADVTADPGAFIAGRVLGQDPQLAAAGVAAAVRGERGVVWSTLKHFPGHGVTAENSHLTVPTVSRGLPAWRAAEARPFAAGIDAGAEAVMMGHLVDVAVDPAPASLSPAWHAVLRGELGFAGLIVSDDLRMLEDSGLAEFADPGRNAVRALGAGSDLLLRVGGSDRDRERAVVAGTVAAVLAAEAAGELPEARLDDAIARVLAARIAAGGVDLSAGCP